MINDNHIEFLKEWFDKRENYGKPFKEAFQALKEEFLLSNALKKIS